MSPRKKEIHPDKRPLVDNAADREQVKEARRTERNQEDQDILDFREVSSTRAGQRLLWRIAARGSIFVPIRHESHADMAWLEGQRDMGLWVLGMWQDSNLESYIEEMTRRNKERR